MGSAYFSLMRKGRQRNINIGTTEGLIATIKTGRIAGGSPEIANPLSKEDAKELFATLRQLMADGEVKNLFINPSRFTIPQKSIILINGAVGVKFIMDTENAMYNIAHIQEESISNAFLDFVESIEGSGLVYSTEESLAALDSIIGEI